ncbi:N-acetylneuraminate synthase [Brevundimonas subvibrioides]|uniref:N-acetylneuraminate synthase n=1 Tax=Brevundimonas subvibrioides (strain ATCC 15264 / DSM 4735 / LMG 14903 / NBRC 16000 / CB 81) TaxID=633149 RepID=D9QKJ6_BRESC|nr:N-acetylneuraminate synthase [Brevundimonas subvibrioides]ADK99821.1 N-acetylneuraminate synthase [Brevundimonas subvibrioides ATCC 15264]
MTERVFFIAEAGVNHNGDLDLALRLVDVAHRAGADAVKFQTFTTDRVIAVDAPLAEYQKANAGAPSAVEMLKGFELPRADFARIADHCRAIGIEFMSSPFDLESAAFLAGIGMTKFKLASGEITHAPFVRGVARLAADAGGSVILSTGMSTLDEVAGAVGWIEGEGCRDLTILHCVSNYPAPAKDANLRAMDTLREAFGHPVGWSDHTLGDAVSLAAVARGARVVEKHFTLDNALAGPDHAMSMDPDGLARLIAGLRTVEASLGDGIKRPVEAEREIMTVARRSLFAARDIAAGAVVTEADLIALRPGDGISAARHADVVGRTAARALPAGTKLAPTDLV